MVLSGNWLAEYSGIEKKCTIVHIWAQADCLDMLMDYEDYTNKPIPHITCTVKVFRFLCSPEGGLGGKVLGACCVFQRLYKVDGRQHRMRSCNLVQRTSSLNSKF